MLLLLAAILVLVLCGLLLVRFIRKYRRSGKSFRIQFVQHAHDGRAPLTDRKILLEDASVTAAQAPLILKPDIRVLVVYAHDSAAHEAAVVALAELLRDVFNLDVHVSKCAGNRSVFKFAFSLTSGTMAQSTAT